MIVVDGMLLVVYKAHDRKLHNVSNTHPPVNKPCQNNHPPTNKFTDDRKFSEVTAPQAQNESNKSSGFEPKYLGGRDVMLIFDDKKLALDVLNTSKLNENRNPLWNWFDDIQPWDPDEYSHPGRLVWVEIKGVPFTCWFESTFNDIAKEWGEIIEQKNCSIDEKGSQDLSSGKVLIITRSLEPIYGRALINHGSTSTYAFVSEINEPTIEFNSMDNESSVWDDDVLSDDYASDEESLMDGNQIFEGYATQKSPKNMFNTNDTSDNNSGTENIPPSDGSSLSNSKRFAACKFPKNLDDTNSNSEPKDNGNNEHVVSSDYDHVSETDTGDDNLSSPISGNQNSPHTSHDLHNSTSEPNPNPLNETTPPTIPISPIQIMNNLQSLNSAKPNIDLHAPITNPINLSSPNPPHNEPVPLTQPNHETNPSNSNFDGSCDVSNKADTDSSSGIPSSTHDCPINIDDNVTSNPTLAEIRSNEKKKRLHAKKEKKKSHRTSDLEFKKIARNQPKPPHHSTLAEPSRKAPQSKFLYIKHCARSGQKLKFGQLNRKCSSTSNPNSTLNIPKKSGSKNASGSSTSTNEFGTGIGIRWNAEH
ncbi:uncharacterized protein [Rutidosis leptorrhynchoides]|uniref:uncharacterized protein n=1 Tax=Rutidosis leptorrhynchoides TaxID=125765 RepID=UPI003A99C370